MCVYIYIYTYIYIYIYIYKRAAAGAPPRPQAGGGEVLCGDLTIISPTMISEQPYVSTHIN